MTELKVQGLKRLTLQGWERFNLFTMLRHINAWRSNHKLRLMSLSPTEIFNDRKIFLIGSTGFLGKVTLSMLLHSFPNIGRVYVTVRARSQEESEARFWNSVITAPPFDPLRERYGDALRASFATRWPCSEATSAKRILATPRNRPRRSPTTWTSFLTAPAMLLSIPPSKARYAPTSWARKTSLPSPNA